MDAPDQVGEQRRSGREQHDRPDEGRHGQEHAAHDRRSDVYEVDQLVARHDLHRLDAHLAPQIAQAALQMARCAALGVAARRAALDGDERLDLSERIHGAGVCTWATRRR